MKDKCDNLKENILTLNILGDSIMLFWDVMVWILMYIKLSFKGKTLKLIQIEVKLMMHI